MPTPFTMEPKSLKTLQLLEAIADGRSTSQRELSDTLQISLGLVNAFIKRLVKKGYCKVTTIPKNRVRYILTPAGAMEKTRLTYEYISTSYGFFKSALKRLQTLFDELQRQGNNRIVFYGIGEIADIALFTMSGNNLELIAVIDPQYAGEQFGRHVVRDSLNINHADFDILVVTALDNHETILKSVEKAGLSADKVRFI